jgi:tetratricopeptide (TPR) repeat protein
VLDAGTTESGRPYFVMELVRGIPITLYCDENQLPIRERLELFATVCQAIQHAHTKGIIHRDIKPTNVLVTRQDGQPLVKVIDFGVAKAMGQQLTEKTLFTEFAQMIGTPLYMSPEQAELSSTDIDTRSDVYSLGVLLYELLTGSTPVTKDQLKQAAFDEIRRIIREEEPPKPSTRISTGDAAPSIAAQRHTEPSKLAKLVRGELDWIVMKALEKDRNRRYETASGFARDVQRYLNDEQVQACPPSTWYRYRKFARRNKIGLAIAALVLWFLVLLGSGVGWAVRDRTARHAKVAGQVALILTEVDQLEKEQKWPEALAAARRAEAAVAGGEADRETSQRVRQRLKDLEFIDRLEQIRMQRAISVEGKFDYAGADRDYARAFREYGVDAVELPVEASIGRLKAHPLFAIPLAAALDDWVDARRRVSETDAAGWKRLVAVARGIDPEPLRDQLRSTWGQPVSESQEDLRRLADSINIRAQHPATLVSLARTLKRVKHSDSALRLLRDAQYVKPGDFWLNFELGAALYEQKDHEGASRFYTAAVAIRPNSVAAHNNLGNALREQKKLDEAIAAYRTAIDLDPKYAKAPNNLGCLLCDDLRDYENAAVCFRKAIELDPKDASAHCNLGNVLVKQNRLDEAVDSYKRATDLEPEYASAYRGLGNVLHFQKNLDEAIAAYRKAIDLEPTYAQAHNSLGCLLCDDLRDYENAAVCFRKAIELDPMYSRAHNGLGNALLRQNRLDEAIDKFKRAIEIDPKDPLPYKNLGNALRLQKKLDEAIACGKTAVELDPNDALAWFLLHAATRELRDQNKWDEVITWIRKTIELRPPVVEAYRELGITFVVQKKYDEAIAAYRQGLQRFPDDYSMHSQLAGLLLRQGRYEEAADSYRQAIKHHPPANISYQYYYLGLTLIELKNHEEAVDALRKAIEDPNFTYAAFAHFNLGSLLSALGQDADAIACYKKAAELGPYIQMAHVRLAWLLTNCSEAKLRDTQGGLEAARRAVEKAPQLALSWQVLGWAHYRAGDWKASIEALEKSCALDNYSKGGNPGQWFFLAMAHWRLGEKDKAREFYDRAVQWMEKNEPTRDELRLFRGEAAELLELKEKQ